MERITIIDYGMGNIGSLVNMFRRIGVATDVTARPDDIKRARKVLLPGVGAFDAAMTRIDDLGLRDILRAKALEDKIPFLGICLGMQLLLSESAEGHAKGLDLIPGAAHRFPKDAKLKVPHMGWSQVLVKQDTALTSGLPDIPRFYFVHSYFAVPQDPAHVMLACDYGKRFAAGVAHDNIYGAQFHPEKSHKFGMALLKGFAEIPC